MIDHRPERAFPSTFKSFAPEQEQVHTWGMELRDYFAAKAMADMTWQFHASCAQQCYRIADAMLEARK